MTVLGLALLIGTTTYAQGTKNAAEEILVDGFKVIYKPSNSPVVSARWVIRGGTVNYAKDKEGIELLTLKVATEGGTANYPKDAYFRTLEKLGSTINTTSELDLASIELSGIQQNFNAGWALFADVITNPAFLEAEFALEKEKQVAEIQEGVSDPDTYLDEMSKSDAFANLDYSKKPTGSEESVNALKLSDCKDYYKKVMSKSQCFLVVVGKLDKNDLIAKVKVLVKNLPQGNYVRPTPTMLNITKSSMNVEERDIATNYIMGLMNGPASGTEEAYAMSIGFSILYDRLFDEIRTKRGLSYAPGAGFRSYCSPYSFVYVTTVDPNAAVKVIIDELKKIKQEGFSEKELKDTKGSFLTNFYMGQETTSAQTQGLASNEVRSTWKNSLMLVENCNKVNLKQLNETFSKYVKGIRWSYLGAKAKADSKVFLVPLN